VYTSSVSAGEAWPRTAWTAATETSITLAGRRHREDQPASTGRILGEVRGQHLDD
jgi:hypothetical protein